MSVFGEKCDYLEASASIRPETAVGAAKTVERSGSVFSAAGITSLITLVVAKGSQDGLCPNEPLPTVPHLNGANRQP